MLILDDLFVSKEVFDYLEASQEPVFDNQPARNWAAQGHNLNIVPADGSFKPERIVGLSEMYLGDAAELCTPDIKRAIDLCKDKAAMRAALAPLYPNYAFFQVSIDELDTTDPAAIPYPVVLKPATGFFSLGIYPLFSAEDWVAAVADIKAQSATWSSLYNERVVNNAQFIVESYLEGQEYALDAYYDENGETVVLDILQHDFAGTQDTSDRLYYTSKHIIEEQLEPMTCFLADCNKLLGFRNFPVHVEVRVQEDGTIIPIEFNPCRFAGLCGTDVSYFAYGFKTYEYFLANKRPNWDELLAGKDGLVYPMILLTKEGITEEDHCEFDYERFTAQFRHMLGIRPQDAARYNSFGFMFLEVREEDWATEVEPLLADDLEAYISRS